MRRLAATISLALVVLCAACSGGSSYTAPSSTPSSTSIVANVDFARTTLRIGDTPDARAIDVEVAATAVQSTRGLGYRDSLPADAGMIFDLHQVREPPFFFWMKGMRFPLDMVWIDENMRVIGVTTGVQPEPGVADAQLAHYSPPGPTRYVLELNSGAAARLGVTPGTPLAFTLP